MGHFWQRLCRVTVDLHHHQWDEDEEPVDRQSLEENFKEAELANGIYEMI